MSTVVNQQTTSLFSRNMKNSSLWTHQVALSMKELTEGSPLREWMRNWFQTHWCHSSLKSHSNYYIFIVIIKEHNRDYSTERICWICSSSLNIFSGAKHIFLRNPTLDNWTVLAEPFTDKTDATTGSSLSWFNKVIAALTFSTESLDVLRIASLVSALYQRTMGIVFKNGITVVIRWTWAAIIMIIPY